MTISDDFIFEEWEKLARLDKEAFEQQRKNYIQKYIDEIPESYRQRIVRIQWRLDMERKIAKSPLDSCINMFNQMWESLYGPQGLSSHLNEIAAYQYDPEVSLKHLALEKPIKNNVTNIRSRKLESEPV